MEEGQSFTLKPDEIPFATTGLDTPTFYVEYIRGAMFSPTMAKLSFVENRINAVSNEVNTIHIVTLVLPLDQVRSWANFLTEQAERIEKMQTKIAEGPDGAAS